MTQPTKSLTELGNPPQQSSFPWDRFDLTTAAAERRRAVTDLGAQGVFNRIYERSDSEYGYISNAQYFAVVVQPPPPSAGGPLPPTVQLGYWLIFTIGQKDGRGTFQTLATTSQFVPTADPLVLPHVHLVLAPFDNPLHTGAPNEPQDT